MSKRSLALLDEVMALEPEERLASLKRGEARLIPFEVALEMLRRR